MNTILFGVLDSKTVNETFRRCLSQLRDERRMSSSCASSASSASGTRMRHRLLVTQTVTSSLESY
jgi:hypothetical protein